MIDLYKIGINILTLRKQKNMTQVELAKMLNVSHQAVSKWERGESMPDIGTLPVLAEIFGKSIDDILMNDYVGRMRKLIGHEMLLTVGCGAIIEDESGRILLQKRKDNNLWGIPGGLMEIGETVEETVIREVHEETGLIIKSMVLMGMYSGKNCFSQYPNGDKIYSLQVIFRVDVNIGIIKQEGEESFEHRFFDKNHLPSLNPVQSPFILDWAEGITGIISK